MVSADRGLVKNITATWNYTPGSGDQRNLNFTLALLGLSGGLGIDPTGQLSVSQGLLTGLNITVGPPDKETSLALDSLKVVSLNESGRSESLELNGFECRFPQGGSGDPMTPADLKLGALAVQALDLSPMVRRLTHLSMSELAEMWLVNTGWSPSQNLSADLLLNRPFDAIKADFSDLALTFGQGWVLAVRKMAITPLTRFSLKAKLEELSLDLGASPEASPGADPRVASPGRTAWPVLLAEANLAHLSANLELSSVYEPTGQTYVFMVNGFEMPELLRGDLKLELSGLDRASLSSLSHLTYSNPVDPLMESGLHHSEFIGLSVRLEDKGLINRLLSASQPRSDDANTTAVKAQRLADLVEMALTMRLDESVENIRELSGLIRTFLADPGQVEITVNPEPHLTPGEVEVMLTRDLPTLLNSLNITLSPSRGAPLKVVFRADPLAFDHDYTQDDQRLYPSETAP
jgi:hypothetical protein